MTTLQKFIPLIACLAGNIALLIIASAETGRLTLSGAHFITIAPTIMIVIQFIRSFRKQA
jgi:hypothetical protein